MVKMREEQLTLFDDAPEYDAFVEKFKPKLTTDDCYTPEVGAGITYANGAQVSTSFVTNLDSCLLRTAPELYEAVKRENDKNEKSQKKQFPKYEYPNHVITAALAQKWCHYGVKYRLERKDAAMISALDAQKEKGKAIFGRGFLLSDKAAAERAAAERWNLSDRERAIVARLGL